MEEAILSLPAQLNWQPALIGSPTSKFSKFVVAGMGGSALAASLLKIREPELDLLIHRDYELPPLPDYFLNEALCVASSYSGNTEETLSFFEAARARGLSLVVIASGGRLLELARERGVSAVALPTGLQPRAAMGYSLRALLALMGRADLNQELETLAAGLDPAAERAVGQELAGRLGERVPLIYASTRNWPLAYTWKITLNETAKRPAFAAALPEANHNELEGFDAPPAERAALAQRYLTLLLTDTVDHPRVRRRFEILPTTLASRGVETINLPLEGGNAWEKIFKSWLLANWTAISLAQTRGLDPAAVPLVEEFKQTL